ncbi:hypothetical protein [uncultured Rothia sp.]|uniref:hypothetical protein n=1 Tax=uncultured Rothia sp. TaxID=316088 RepID=UPI003217AA2F
MSVRCEARIATPNGHVFYTSDHPIADGMTLEEYLHYIRYERTLYTPGEHTTYTVEWPQENIVVETCKRDGTVTTRRFYDPDQPELF